MAEHLLERIKLPEPKYKSGTSVEESLLRRRSVRTFKDAPVMLAELSQLLWAGQGTTDARGFRTAPSAGALYPLELYVVAGNVNGLHQGAYKYLQEKHELLIISESDRRDDLCSASLGQSSVRRAALVLVMSAVSQRVTAKYGERGIRYTHMEAGHAAQNICLQAVSLQLRSVVIGAFQDREVLRLLKMGTGEIPLYIIPVGK